MYVAVVPTEIPAKTGSNSASSSGMMGRPRPVDFDKSMRSLTKPAEMSAAMARVTVGCDRPVASTSSLLDVTVFSLTKCKHLAAGFWGRENADHEDFMHSILEGN